MPRKPLIVESQNALGETNTVRRLADFIRQGAFGVGDRLPGIRELCRQLDLGPTVVRDGLVKLEARGLVEIRQRSGVYVKAQDYSSLVAALSDTLDNALAQKDPDLFHLVQTRLVLEFEAVGVAAQRRLPQDLQALREALEDFCANPPARDRHLEADEQFHLTIAGISGNTVLCMMLGALLMVLRPYRRCQVLPAERWEATKHEHEQLYRAIAAGEVDAARAAMRAHLAHLQRSLVDLDAGAGSGNRQAVE